MPTLDECVCYCEYENIKWKPEESVTSCNCITENKGFEQVYLNAWVLQTAHFQYRQEYGHDDEDEFPQE